MFKLHLYPICVLLLLTAFTHSAKCATYYSKGNLSINLASSWSTTRDGTGGSPATVTGAHTWIIQSGDSMFLTGSATLTLSTATVKIESGGIFMNATTSSSVLIDTFQLCGGAVYLHNSSTTSVPGSTRQFANSTNGGQGHGTVVVNAYANASIPGVYGNLIINHNNTYFWTHTGILTDVEGDFTFNTGSANPFRLVSAKGTTFTIGGNFYLLSGLFQVSNAVAGSHTYTINIGGNFYQSGGTFSPNTGTSPLSLKFTGSGKSFSRTGGQFIDTMINWTIDSGASLTLMNDLEINASRLLTVNGGLNIDQNRTVEVKGALNNYGVIAGAGSLIMNGSVPQLITGTGSVANLEVNNPTGVTIANGSMVNLTGVLTSTSGTLVTNNGLTLKSTAIDTTARVAPIMGAISGNVTVERFIPGKRAWRLLTAPVHGNSDTSVFGHWQNNGVPDGHYGAEVWKPVGTGPAGDGLAAGPAASLRTYDPVANAWANVTNTRTQPLFTGNRNNPFMLFVTGPYGSNNISSGYGATTLRASGELITGTQSYTVNRGINTFALIGNPYACPVDFDKAYLNGGTSGIARKFWAWDPSLNQVGGYVTVQYDSISSSYDITPPTSANQFMQSGQAIFIQATAPAAQFVIEEDDKETTSGNTPVFRTNGGYLEKLRVNLYTVPVNSIPALIDGALINFHENFSATINPSEDAFKFFNINESISIRTNGGKYAIEGRPLADHNDTIRIGLNGMRQGAFQIVLDPAAFNATGLSATLFDTYLSSSIPVNLTAQTVYPFMVDAVAASGNDNRFFIVFHNADPLNMQFLSIKAWKQEKQVHVLWEVASQKGVVNYQVERSIDGSVFKSLSDIPATGQIRYQYTDTSLFHASVYYRIKAVTERGQMVYSPVAQVHTKSNVSISLYPNPVGGDKLSISVSGITGSNHRLTIYNTPGQVMSAKDVRLHEARSDVSIDLAHLPPGIYYLAVADAAGNTIAGQKFIRK